MEPKHSQPSISMVPVAYRGVPQVLQPHSTAERRIDTGVRLQLLIEQGIAVKNEYAMATSGALTVLAAETYLLSLQQLAAMRNSLDDAELYRHFVEFSSQLLGILGAGLTAMMAGALRDLQRVVGNEIQPTDAEVRGFWRRLFGI